MTYNVDATKALIDGVLQASDPRLAARFDATDEPESEDDQFTVTLDGLELKRGLSGAGVAYATYSVQCCMIGGGFVAHEYANNANDEVCWMRLLYDGNNAKAAAQAIVDALADAKPRPEPTPRPQPASTQVDTLQGGMVAAAESVDVVGRFRFDTSNLPSVTVTDTETGRSHTLGLHAYRAVRETLGALFTGE